MEHRAPYKHVVCLFTHPRPLVWSFNGKTFFSESSHVAYQINGNGAMSTMQAHSLSYTHLLSLGQVKSSDIEIVQISLFFIKLSAKNS